jgi:hypothetical protein
MKFLWWLTGFLLLFREIHSSFLLNQLLDPFTPDDTKEPLTLSIEYKELMYTNLYVGDKKVSALARRVG